MASMREVFVLTRQKGKIMRLSTIWTLHNMSTMERLRRTREWAVIEIASKLPKRIRYWVTIQEIAKATMDSPNIPATPLDYVLKKLDSPTP